MQGQRPILTLTDEMTKWTEAMVTQHLVTGALNETIRFEHVRVWKGDDGKYLILTIPGEYGNPPGVFDRLYYGPPGPEPECYVVRNVEFDMRKDTATVSAIDEASFVRMTRRPVPRPPRFKSLAEADAWLEAHTPR